MTGAAEHRRSFVAVLDASALLALLHGERGADAVVDVLSRGAAISAVNWCEVLGKLVDAGSPPDDTEQSLLAAGVLDASLEIVEFDRDQAREAAALRESTRSRGLSLGDRACLALARKLGAKAVTADQGWAGLELGIELRLVR